MPTDIEKQHAQQEFAAGRPRLLEGMCRDVLREVPGDTWAAIHLCNLLARRGDYLEAIAIAEAALAAQPRVGSHLLNLAHFNLKLKRPILAFDYAQQAVGLLPEHEMAWINLSSAACACGRFQDAVAAASRALALNPASVGATNNLATAYQGLGQMTEAIAAYRKATALDPGNATSLTNLLLTMVYDARTPVSEIVQVAREYATRFERAAMGKRRAHRNTALPDRRLRIGFLSPDLNSHAVMYFAEPVLHGLGRQQFEIYCYSTSARSDPVTERLKSTADQFRYLPVANPEQAAATIQDDEVDILIDLAGHTAGNGLQIMCYRPAPVQVTWLGYPGTTGLSCMDWRITDAVADPPQADQGQYTEGLVRLPTCFCVYRPHIRDPGHRWDARYQVCETPALANGYVTFGSCNNLAKLSEESVSAWSRILNALPGAKLLLEGKDLSNPDMAQRWIDKFGRHGVAAQRLILEPRDARNQYLTYHQVDIALDPFPLTGGTTTFDALWMGVPVVSLMGATFRERLSGSILTHGGFTQDLTPDVDGYVARALELAADIGALNRRRLLQRERMCASPLMDEARFATLFGKALRMMWHKWCARHEPQGLATLGDTPTGGDVLVVWGDRRVTLTQALAWLEQLRAPAAAEDAETAARPKSVTARRRSLAEAILLTTPESDPAGSALR